MYGSTATEATLAEVMAEGRSFFAWQDRPVEEDLLHRLYEMVRMGPTSTNSNPTRFVFVTSPEARAGLVDAVWEGNRAKTEAAPVTVIVAQDTRFYELVPELFVHRPEVAESFAKDPKYAAETAFRNAAMQGAYMILCARALGLDCGPMSGFNAERMDQAFFPDGRWKTNFLINLGYGDRSVLFPRLPRLSFETACRIV